MTRRNDMPDEILHREQAFETAERGPVVPVPKGKTRITTRLDENAVEWLRQVHAAGGGSYQTLINTALRSRMPTSLWRTPCDG